MNRYGVVFATAQHPSVDQLVACHHRVRSTQFTEIKCTSINSLSSNSTAYPRMLRTRTELVVTSAVS